jgi:hypothetical protein
VPPRVTTFLQSCVVQKAVIGQHFRQRDSLARGRPQQELVRADHRRPPSINDVTWDNEQTAVKTRDHATIPGGARPKLVDDL